MVRLRRRQEFLAATRHGRRIVMPAFVLQAVTRPERDDGEAIGLGFTVSRKVGKAVARNRARRRLREAARAVFPGPAQSGTNYVIVARATVLTWPFDRLLHDLRKALERVSRAGGRSRSGC
ncbi:MAG: ribonuclease P protein component [Geminicoccaceae bacterium]|nr:ribonuclease P protein component [Geminicoccaceae bacterium]